MSTTPQSPEVSSTEPAVKKERAMKKKNEVKPEAKPNAAQSDSASTDESTHREPNYDTKKIEKRVVAVNELTAGNTNAAVAAKLALVPQLLALLLSIPGAIFSAKRRRDAAADQLEQAALAFKPTYKWLGIHLRDTDAGARFWRNCKRRLSWKTMENFFAKWPSTEGLTVPSEILAAVNSQGAALVALGKAAAQAQVDYEKTEASFATTKAKLERLLTAIPAQIRVQKIEDGTLRHARGKKSQKSGAGDGGTPPSGEGSTPPAPPVAPPTGNSDGGATASE